MHDDNTRGRPENSCDAAIGLTGPTILLSHPHPLLFPLKKTPTHSITIQHKQKNPPKAEKSLQTHKIILKKSIHSPHRTPSVATAMPADASPPPPPLPWKLYQNPHFLPDSLHHHHHHHHLPLLSSTDNLSLALAEISDLRTQLELERRTRRAFESLAKSIARDLSDERRARADAEAEAARCRAAIGEAEEDRRTREVGEKENPHVRRGIKGFVEFSRAIRVRSTGTGRGGKGKGLEGERAQLRVLMK